MVDDGVCFGRGRQRLEVVAHSAASLGEKSPNVDLASLHRHSTPPSTTEACESSQRLSHVSVL
jgi:predicted Fe-S protein YdhL (DUF1289 family)